jgi:D-glycero-alpha-D-manno-heptose-7-phosphate kinase
MKDVIRTSAPVRVDLAGGTLDLWPLSMLLTRAVTVNLALGLRAGCELEPGGDSWRFESRGAEPLVLTTLPARPERSVPPRFQLAAVVAAHYELPPCRIRTWSDAAPGSGLGGSSSLVIALLKAAASVAGEAPSDADAVALACNLETRVLRLPAGSQDHWAAQCGGLSILDYRPEGVARRAATRGTDLASSLVVADTRVAHHSGMNNWAILRAALEGDAAVLARLEEIGEAATAMADAVEADVIPELRLQRAGEAMRREWDARRRLAPEVSCPEVEAVVSAARSVDGSAKVCGAGGGGCVACLPAAPSDRERLLEAVQATGASVLSVEPSAEGVRFEVAERPESC